MARYRKIDVRIWNDEKFSQLSDTAQLAFLYVLTHPTMTSLGALRSSPENLAGEKYGWSDNAKDLRKGFLKAFQELFSKGLLKADCRGLIYAPNFLKYNSPESPNVIKAWKGSLDLLPECELLFEVIKSTDRFVSGLSKGFQEAFKETFKEALTKDFGEGSSKAMPNQEQEQDIYIPSKDGIVETDVPTSAQPQKTENTSNGIPCPYTEITAAFNEILGPYLGMCKKLTDSRKKAVQARWRECIKDGDFDTQDSGIEYFKRYFNYIKNQSFLTGSNDRNWRADFDWIFKSQNYTKICEGKYLRS